MFTRRKQNLTWSLALALSLTAFPLLSAPVMAASSNAAEVENHTLWTATMTSCSGEPVPLVGDMRMVSHFHDDGNDGLHVHLSGNQDGSGVGLVSGDEYRFSNSFAINLNGQGSPSVQSFELNSHLNTAGPKNNTYIHTTFHVTINANGEVTVINVDARSDCQ